MKVRLGFVSNSSSSSFAVSLINFSDRDISLLNFMKCVRVYDDESWYSMRGDFADAHFKSRPEPEDDSIDELMYNIERCKESDLIIRAKDSVLLVDTMPENLHLKRDDPEFKGYSFVELMYLIQTQGDDDYHYKIGDKYLLECKIGDGDKEAE